MQRSRLLGPAGVLAAAVFVTQFVWLDLAFRSWRASPWGGVPSVLVWSLALVLAKTRALRTTAAVFAAVIFVVQANVFRYYHAPLDLQVAASALHAWSDVRPVVLRALPRLVLATLLVSAVEYALVSAFHRAPARPKWPGAIAALAGVSLFVVPLRSATPDVRGVHALLALRERETRTVIGAVDLPPLHVERRIPSVLFILTESVRAEDYTKGTAAELAALLRDRVDLAEMRAISSYTAVSFSALLTGRTQEGTREEILRAPNLFDFAHAARRGGERPLVAYFSAQSDEVFETKDVRAAVDRFVTIETMLGHGPDDPDPRTARGVDPIVVEAFEKYMRETAGERPVVSVLHLTDTHAPYVVDPERAPFVPFDHVPSWSKLDELHNAYKNAILAQDHVLARAVRAFVARANGGPWLVVFTSDHGEAFGEHGAIHHGQNLFDEQVHVPGWIAAGPGTLDDAQLAALASHRTRYVTHLDLLPTVLDAMGLVDNFAVSAPRRAMRGESMLRPHADRGALPVTNCTGMFPCPTNTWGMLDGDHKLVARIYDGAWTCLVVSGGPERLVQGPDAKCDELRVASQVTFPLLPNGAPNR